MEFVDPQPRSLRSTCPCMVVSLKAMNEGPVEFRKFILLGYSNQKMGHLAYAEDGYLTLMQSNGGGVI